MTSIPTDDHQAVFRQVWADHVTLDGHLVEEFVARELYDFRCCLVEVRTAFTALAGLDRPDADAKTVLGHAAYEAAAVRVNYLRSRALIVPDDQAGAAELREQLWRIAAQWEIDTPAPAKPELPEPPAWMTAALAAESHADHKVEYRRIWREHLVDEAGQLDRDKVARVLAAYWTLLHTVPGVYQDLAALSKPHIAAHHVIDAAEERWAAIYADHLCDEAYQLDAGPVKTALVELATEWHPSAWAEHLEGRTITDRLAALAKSPQKEGVAA